MPQPYRPGLEPLHKTYTLEKAAKDGMIVVVRCTLCRRIVRFLATDLLEMINPLRDAYLPPYPCSICGKGEYLHVTVHMPSAGDYGHLVVRRPAGVRRVQMWKSVKLGD
jgi:hypothetical protein